MWIAGGVIILGAGAAALLLRKGGDQPAPGAAAGGAAATPAGTTPPAATAPAVAAAPTMGFIRLIGDLPNDAIIWLDTAQLSGMILRVLPGSYTLEVETEEFEPWERRVTVRAGDTLRVRVELELKADSTETP